MTGQSYRVTGEEQSAPRALQLYLTRVCSMSARYRRHRDCTRRVAENPIEIEKGTRGRDAGRENRDVTRGPTAVKYPRK